MADGRITGDFVTDDDQPEVAVLGVAGELVADDGECLYQSGNVLLRADIAGVEQEGVVDLIALHDAAPLLILGCRSCGTSIGRVPVPEKLGIGCPIDQPYAFGWNLKDIDHIAAGGGGHRHHLLSPQ